MELRDLMVEVFYGEELGLISYKYIFNSYLSQEKLDPRVF